ncbi:hypothetical protein [Clostridium tarantellae]|uniref:Uncharacterized protein n=1 Tax=Clostridium tarantellae TaxID=39493 RepID=A0A6I1MHW1_9CLOT|nr:hypothetical protein [Clostridium tarantellae]MPQ42333.1 hypothetical protein [Clostridium tarantellae]
MIIGIPCSGKSYYCKDKYNNSNAIIILTDEIRKEITGHMNMKRIVIIWCLILLKVELINF